MLGRLLGLLGLCGLWWILLGSLFLIMGQGFRRVSGSGFLTGWFGWMMLGIGGLGGLGWGSPLLGGLFGLMVGS